MKMPSRGNSQSCPKEDEPGGRVYFQRDMSLKAVILGSSENDLEIAYPKTADGGGDPFVPDGSHHLRLRTPVSREETYKWVRDSLWQLRYSSLPRADRGAVRDVNAKVKMAK